MIKSLVFLSIIAVAWAAPYTAAAYNPYIAGYTGYSGYQAPYNNLPAAPVAPYTAGTVPTPYTPAAAYNPYIAGYNGYSSYNAPYTGGYPYAGYGNTYNPYSYRAPGLLNRPYYK